MDHLGLKRPRHGTGLEGSLCGGNRVRFQSDISGYITGIRFYKWSTNTGTHVGNLWTNTGTLLATVTFTGETASGWQTMYFSNPVAISANTPYVASYFTTTGYAVTTTYFTVGVDNAPLHALASGVDGLNGLYHYNATSIFPAQSTKTSNYWVDVVFNTSPMGGANRLCLAKQPSRTNLSIRNIHRSFPNPRLPESLACGPEFRETLHHF